MENELKVVLKIKQLTSVKFKLKTKTRAFSSGVLYEGSIEVYRAYTLLS